ncbi:MAG: DUF1934 domain-containing protein [Clostridia bacterium]
MNNNMDKDVLISLKGISGQSGGEPMEFITEGKYSRIGDVYYVSYQESRMTGMDGTTTTLEIDKDSVTMRRKGSVNTSFMFKKGQKSVSHYSTEYGVFTINIVARDLDIRVDDNGGELEIIYEMDAFDNKGSRNNFSMKIREV